MNITKSLKRSFYVTAGKLLCKQIQEIKGNDDRAIYRRDDRHSGGGVARAAAGEGPAGGRQQVAITASSGESAA